MIDGSGWRLTPGMGLDFSRVEFTPPLQPCMEFFCGEVGHGSRCTMFSLLGMSSLPQLGK